MLPCLERDGIEGHLCKFMLYVYLVIMEPFCKMMRSHAAVAFSFKAAGCTEYYVHKKFQGGPDDSLPSRGRPNMGRPNNGRLTAVGSLQIIPGFLVISLIVGVNRCPPTSLRSYSWVKASPTRQGRWVHASLTVEASLTMFSQPSYFCTHSCRYVLNTKYYQNTSLTMRISTTEREARLTEAIDEFHAHNGTVSVLKIADKHKVNRGTLTNRINGKHRSIASNGGLNRLLAVAQLGALFLYIRKQALAGFPCTWAMILAAVSWIRAQDGQSPPSRSWSKKFQRKNGPVILGGFHKIRWKLMDAKRRAAQIPQVVKDWFKGLEQIQIFYKIRPENM